MKTSRHLTLSLLTLSWLTLSASTAAAQLVTINNVSINYTNNQLTINGSGFEPAKKAPTVNFNGANLALVSYTNSVVVAQLPTTAAGTYQLIVTNSEGLLWLFDVTYGAVGPQGPPGATGATGATGPLAQPGQQDPREHQVRLGRQVQLVPKGQQVPRERPGQRGRKDPKGCHTILCRLPSCAGTQQTKLGHNSLWAPSLGEWLLTAQTSGLRTLLATT